MPQGMTNLNHPSMKPREPISQTEFEDMINRQFMPTRYKAAPELERAYLRRYRDPVGKGKVPAPVVVIPPDPTPLKDGLRGVSTLLGYAIVGTVILLAYLLSVN